MKGFAVNLGRIKVAHALPAVKYQPRYFFTRYPLETTKMWNLIYLFTPTCWMWTFLSIASIVISLKIFNMIGTRLGLNLLSEEITLYPFRYGEVSKKEKNVEFSIFRTKYSFKSNDLLLEDNQGFGHVLFRTLSRQT